MLKKIFENFFPILLIVLVIIVVISLIIGIRQSGIKSGIQFTNLKDTEATAEKAHAICVKNNKAKTIVFNTRYIVDTEVALKSYIITKVICNDGAEFKVDH